MNVAQKALNPTRGRWERSLRSTPAVRLRRAGLAVALLVTVVSVSGCSIDNVWLRFGWPSGVTPQAHRMRELWTWSVLAALVMGVIVWGLTFWTVAFHRKKKDSPEFPRQTGYNVPLELSYTALPFVIIAILFYFTVVVQNYVNDKSAHANVVVDVTAYQWNWKFGYRTVDMDGKPVYNGVDLDRQNQLTLEDRKAKEHKEDGEPRPGAIHGKDPSSLSYLHYDKIETVGSSDEIPVLVLPTNRVVEFHIASADVIHGFWVPQFLFKRDVNPNPEANHSDNVFQISKIEKEGAFVGRCAEMCGTFHSMMNFEVRAVSPEKFDQYIQARRQGSTNAEALRKIHESPIATSTHPFPSDRRIQVASANDR